MKPTQRIIEAHADWKHGVSGNNSWVSEGIWGHRLKSGQTVNVLLSEFLTTAESLYRADLLFKQRSPNDNPEVTVRYSKKLRCILFYNPYFEQILNAELSNDESWDCWIQLMQDNRLEGHPSEYSYLRDRFVSENSFREFAEKVMFLRRITLDPNTSRKWSNQLIFPVGVEALYIPTNAKFERERDLFRRTGELAYLLLSKADVKFLGPLQEYFSKLFDPQNTKNLLLRSLVDDDDLGRRNMLDAYFPYREHEASNRLAEDLLNVFRLELPHQDSLAIIKYLIAFNLYVYVIETAHAWVGGEGVPPIVCEILSPKVDLVRRVSWSSKRENEDLCKRAVESFINHAVSSNRELEELLRSDETAEDKKVAALIEFLRDVPCQIREDLKGDRIQEVLQDASRKAKAHCADGVESAASELARTSGLATKRRTNRYRYAPSDELLNALVLANINTREEESVVLEKLYNRYGIVIGKVQAEKSLDEPRYDGNQFEKNADRFRQRLIALGLADRLSDACTYISNRHVDDSLV